jgi:hypothetical protein
MSNIECVFTSLFKIRYSLFDIRYSLLPPYPHPRILTHAAGEIYLVTRNAICNQHQRGIGWIFAKVFGKHADFIKYSMRVLLAPVLPARVDCSGKR